MKTKKRANQKRKHGIFDPEAFLSSAGVARTIAEFGKKETLFSQGDLCKNIMYIQKSEGKISVVSETGKEAVGGLLGPRDFIGEGGVGGAAKANGNGHCRYACHSIGDRELRNVPSASRGKRVF